MWTILKTTAVGACFLGVVMGVWYMIVRMDIKMVITSILWIVVLVICYLLGHLILHWNENG